jgi:DNA-binding MarR family transcriptional regulator
MNLDNFSQITKVLRTEYGLDSTDALIINELMRMRGHGDVPTMTLIKNFSEASQATTHTRVKKLIKAGWISRIGDEENLRVRKLVPTEKALNMVRHLGSVL